MIKAGSLNRRKNTGLMLFLHILKSWERRSRWRNKNTMKMLKDKTLNESMNEKSGTFGLVMDGLRQDL